MSISISTGVSRVLARNRLYIKKYVNSFFFAKVSAVSFFLFCSSLVVSSQITIFNDSLMGTPRFASGRLKVRYLADTFRIFQTQELIQLNYHLPAWRILAASLPTALPKRVDICQAAGCKIQAVTRRAITWCANSTWRDKVR